MGLRRLGNVALRINVISYYFNRNRNYYGRLEFEECKMIDYHDICDKDCVLTTRKLQASAKIFLPLTGSD